MPRYELPAFQGRAGSFAAFPFRSHAFVFTPFPSPQAPLTPDKGTSTKAITVVYNSRKYSYGFPTEIEQRIEQGLNVFPVGLQLQAWFRALPLSPVFSPSILDVSTESKHYFQYHLGRWAARSCLIVTPIPEATKTTHSPGCQCLHGSLEAGQNHRPCIPHPL